MTAAGGRIFCAGWDLRALVLHVGDSLGVLTDALQAGQVGDGPLPGHEPTTEADPLACLRRRARDLLGACAASAEERLVAIADRELTASMVTAAGAIEIAVHGWDLSVACGVRQPVPLAPLLIPRTTRAGLFADPVPVPEAACPGDRLVAFLGRRPRSDGSA